MSQLLAPPMLSKLPPQEQAGVASPGAAASSGVVGEPKKLDSASLPAAVVFAIFVVTGKSQQWPLRVPGHCEGGGLTLHLPELLSCMEKEPHQLGEPPVPSAAHLPRAQQLLLPSVERRGSTNAAPAPFCHPVTRYRHDRHVCHGLLRQRLPLMAFCFAQQSSSLAGRFSLCLPSSTSTSPSNSLLAVARNKTITCLHLGNVNEVIF